MNEENQELMFDLLTLKAVYGLDEADERRLDALDTGANETELRSLEFAAAAIGLTGIEIDEPLPAHLHTRITTDAARFVGTAETEEQAPWPPATERYDAAAYDERRSPSWFGWLGWAAAATACAALAVNIWFTQFQPPVEVAKTIPPPDIPKVLTPAEMRESMIRSASKMVTANWAAGNVKELKQIAGDIIWSDDKQTGYMRFRGLPVNDTNKETYQLWIFDKTQDKASPIDGGTFDVTADGEVVIPINAKLKAQEPYLFAITIEKPGGVVVSKREKLAALANVETKVS